MNLKKKKNNNNNNFWDIFIPRTANFRNVPRFTREKKKI